jgi:hypothetical protein
MTVPGFSGFLSRRRYGAFLSALCVNAWPVAEMSSPAPAVVWHAASNGIAAIAAHRVRAIPSLLVIEVLLLMEVLLVGISI